MATVGDIEFRITSETRDFDAGMSSVNRRLQETVRSSGSARGAIIGLNNVVRDSPFDWVAIAGNVDQVVDSFGNLVRQTGSVRGALSGIAAALGPGAVLAIGISTISSLAIAFGDEIAAAFGKAEKSAKDLEGALDGVISVASALDAIEFRSVRELERSARTLQARADALRKLNQEIAAAANREVAAAPANQRGRIQENALEQLRANNARLQELEERLASVRLATDKLRESEQELVDVRRDALSGGLTETEQLEQAEDLRKRLVAQLRAERQNREEVNRERERSVVASERAARAAEREASALEKLFQMGRRTSGLGLDLGVVGPGSIGFPSAPVPGAGVQGLSAPGLSGVPTQLSISDGLLRTKEIAELLVLQNELNDLRAQEAARQADLAFGISEVGFAASDLLQTAGVLPGALADVADSLVSLLSQITSGNPFGIAAGLLGFGGSLLGGGGGRGTRGGSTGPGARVASAETHVRGQDIVAAYEITLQQNKR